MFVVSVSSRYRLPHSFQGIIMACARPRALFAMSGIIGVTITVRVLSNPCVLSVFTTRLTSFSNHAWLSIVRPPSSMIWPDPLSVPSVLRFSFTCRKSSWL